MGLRQGRRRLGAGGYHRRMRFSRLDAVAVTGALVLGTVGFVSLHGSPEPSRTVAATTHASPAPTATPTSGAAAAARARASAAQRAAHLTSVKELTRQRQQVARAQLRAQQRAAHAAKLAATPFGFRIQVMNVLGSNHTSPSGDKPRYAPGRVRASWERDVIRRVGSDIVGFAEMQRDQYGVMAGSLPDFGFYPGTAWGSKGIPTNVMWRTSRFDLTGTDSVTIPFVGQQRPMPIVRLKDKATGRQFYVFNAHNAPNGRQSERDAAVRLEIAKIQQLRKTGLPVFFLGDLNEHQTVFCKVVGQTDLESASGGSVDSSGCHPPRGMRIDWIFGSSSTFSGFNYFRDREVARSTDHTVPFANVTVN